MLAILSTPADNTKGPSAVILPAAVLVPEALTVNPPVKVAAGTDCVPPLNSTILIHVLFAGTGVAEVFWVCRVPVPVLTSIAPESVLVTRLSIPPVVVAKVPLTIILPAAVLVPLVLSAK